MHVTILNFLNSLRAAKKKVTDFRMLEGSTSATLPNSNLGDVCTIVSLDTAP
jgi:hypothetical protein